MFDLKPEKVESVGRQKNGSTTDLVTFIPSFPLSLPAITPTLGSLVSLLFQGLTEHASALSTALLVALFDDGGEFDVESSSVHSPSVRAVRRRQRERFLDEYRLQHFDLIYTQASPNNRAEWVRNRKRGRERKEKKKRGGEQGDGLRMLWTLMRKGRAFRRGTMTTPTPTIRKRSGI
jgi:hypothetical protein